MQSCVQPDTLMWGAPSRILPPNTTHHSRVLLADDSYDFQVLVAAYLSGTNYELDLASNGLVAVQKAQQADYDVLLLDIRMPLMDGIAAAREIRRWEFDTGRRVTPIITITANAEAKLLRESSAAGCDGCLPKPVSQPRLLRAIAQVLMSATSAHARRSHPVRLHAVMRALVPAYLDSVRNAVEMIEKALDSGQLAEIARVAHNLKGTGAPYGFPEISNIGRCLEAFCRDRDVESLRSATLRLKLLLLDAAG